MPKSYTEDAMSAAVADVKSNNISTRRAAKKYSVPKSSLSDRVIGKVQEGAKWGRRSVFDTGDEKEMIECALKRSEMGIGFSKSNFIRFARAMAESRGVKFKNGKPSDMWWRRFKTRHNQFSLCSPEPTGTVRHDAMSCQRMTRFFEELGKIVMSPNFKDEPSRIWNMDETGISLSHKPNKVLAKRGAKAIHGKTSTSRKLITVIACGNAFGNYLPPHFIIPGKTKRKLEGYDLESTMGEDSSIKGANFSVSESGWTKDGIAKLWFTETFLKNIGPARPQLLICDGHGSHNNVEFVQLAKQNDIVIVELPSHTSNWTQLFDRTVFKSLKSHWNTTLDNFIKGTGVAVGHKQFLKLFNIAWRLALTPSTIRNGFASTGIYPFNPDAIPSEAYAPNELNDPNPFDSVEMEIGAVGSTTQTSAIINVANVTSFPPTQTGPVANITSILPTQTGPVDNASSALTTQTGPVANITSVLPTQTVPVANATSVLPTHTGPVANVTSALPTKTDSVTDIATITSVNESLMPSSSAIVGEVNTLSRIQGTDSVAHEAVNDISLNPNSDHVSSVTLSIPLNLEGEFTLPVIYDPFDGLLFDSSFSEDPSLDNTKCTPKEALDVIENTLTSEQKLQFHAVLVSGSNTKLNKHPLFQTWRYYTQLINNTSLNNNITVNPSANLVTTPTSEAALPGFSANVPLRQSTVSLSSTCTATAISATSIANDIFPLPKPPKKKREMEYFVITADEIFNQKKNASELKMKQIKIKEEKRIERERKRAEKALTKTNENKKQRGHSRGNKKPVTEML